MKNKLICIVLLIMIIIFPLEIQAAKTVTRMTFAEICSHYSNSDNLPEIYGTDTEVLEANIAILEGVTVTTEEKTQALRIMKTVIRNREGRFITWDEIYNYYTYELNGSLERLDTDVVRAWAQRTDCDVTNEQYRKIREDAQEEYTARNSFFQMNTDYWKPSINTTGNTNFFNMIGSVLGIIQMVGSSICVITLVIMGMQYMFASVEEKAKYKEKMIPYVVGCLMLFGIINITSIIVHVIAILFFVISRQTYLTSIIFILFIIKILVIIKNVYNKKN